MGELPPATGPHALHTTTPSPAQEENQSLVTGPSNAHRFPGSNAAFNSQFSAMSQSRMSQDPSRQPVQRSESHRYPNAQLQEQDLSALNMGAMVGTLPEYPTEPNMHHPQMQQPQQQRPLQGASTPAVVYQLQQISQMRSSAPMPFPGHAPYTPGYGHGQYQQNFLPAQGLQPGALASVHTNPQRQAGSTTMSHAYQTFQQPPAYLYYPPYGPQPPFAQPFPSQVPPQQAIFPRRSSLSSAQAPMLGQNFDLPLQEGPYPRGFEGGRPMGIGVSAAAMGPGSMVQVGMSRPIQNTSFSSIPRGPPRKPKQSGHALWVGNLPPGTTVMDLKDHFSRDATKDIESLFLISKSNCAFVNYRTEESCTAAMHRFHDSRFQGVRLVCRLRRSSAPASGVPTGPSAMRRQPSHPSPPHSPTVAEKDNTSNEPNEASAASGAEDKAPKSDASVKYFIVKSLTLQDLELSVRNGIWATQSHNEEVLSNAYETAEKVYLIFSANKSGEYFGYARMASPIMEDFPLVSESAPSTDTFDSVDVPKSVPTPATEFAPKGRIIDDSARGTIFWEAELSDVEEQDTEHTKDDKHEHDESESVVAQSWGRPFKVEWISTNRLPFYRTRGLRNPWNANREVKVARDGTELETSVGERLIQMFHRLGSSNASSTMMPPHQMGGYQMPPY